MPSLSSSAELNFLSKNGKFFYPAALYSAGMADLDLTNVAVDEARFIKHRKQAGSFIMADSAGFQALRRTIKIDWDDPDDVLIKLLRWQEFVCDVGMLVDIPTNAVKDEHPIFDDFEKCLNQSLYNARFFLEHQDDKIPFIIPIQGSTPEEAIRWYDEIKFIIGKGKGWDLPQKPPKWGGWAFGGGIGRNFNVLLPLLVHMWKDNGLAFAKYIHFFGIGTTLCGVVLSLLQAKLRQAISENIQITFDASNPSYTMSLGGIFHTAIKHPDQILKKLSADKFVKVIADMDQSKPIKDIDYYSPILSTITIEDMMSPGSGKRDMDNLTYQIMNIHNTYVLVASIAETQQTANIEILAADAEMMTPEKRPYSKALEHVLAMRRVFKEAFKRDADIPALCNVFKEILSKPFKE